MIKLRASIELPEWMEGGPVSLRTHNGWMKDMVRDELEFHRTNRVKRHFERSAHARYGYAKRKPKYQSWKIKNRGKQKWMTNSDGVYVLAALAPDSDLDLVRSGTTKRRIGKQDWKITAGGSGNKVRGLLTMKVPIPGGTGRSMPLAKRIELVAKGRLKTLGNAAMQSSRMETVRRTINEIERFSDDEVKEINQKFAKQYAHKMNNHRKRVKIPLLT